MKHVKKAIIIFLALILQNTLGGQFEVLGIKPSLFIVATVTVSLSCENPWESLIYGLAAGVLFDILWGRVFGVMTILLMYTAVAVYYVEEFLYKKTVVEAVTITLLGTIIIETVFYGANFALFGEGDFIYVILRIIIPGAAYNAIVQAILFGSITKFLGKKEVKVREV